MPRGKCLGQQESAKFAGEGSAGSSAWVTILDSDEWRRSKRYAGLVEIARAATVAVDQLHQIVGTCGIDGKQNCRQTLVLCGLERVIEDHRQPDAGSRDLLFHDRCGRFLVD